MADFKVEAKFDGTNWTDISEWSEGIRIRRGRSGDLALVDPGVCTILLDNDDGRFTPTNTQGAYSPNVKPRVEVRVSADSTVLFTGRAQRWTPSWTVDLDAIVTLEAVDAFEELRQVDIPWASNAFIRDNDPDAYWPLDDRGDTQRDHSGNGRDLDTFSGITTGGSALVTGGDGSVSVTDDAANFEAHALHNNPPESWFGASNDITFSAWIRWDTRNTDPVSEDARAHIFRVVGDTGSPINDFHAGWDFQAVTDISGDDRLRITIYKPTTSQGLTSDVTSWAEDTTYQVGFHWDTSTDTVTFYRNGVDIGSAVSSESAVSSSKGQASGIGTDLNSVVRMAEFALWTSDQSSLMSFLHDAGDGFASDSPNLRITRVLNWAGWPAGDRDLDDGTTPLAGIAGGGSALSECQDAAAADGGVFYIAKAGDATFQGRSGRWSADTVQFTFDDDGTDTPYEQIGWRYDTTLLHNRVIINSNTQGTSDGVSEDSTSIGTYGKRELTISTISNNSADNKERADWEVARRRDPHLRLERIGGHVGDSDEQATFKGVELQDLVEAIRRPGTGQDDLTVKLRVSAVEHSVSNAGRRWDGMLELTEAETDLPARYDAGFVYDVPDSYYAY